MVFGGRHGGWVADVGCGDEVGGWGVGGILGGVQRGLEMDEGCEVESEEEG